MSADDDQAARHRPTTAADVAAWLAAHDRPVIRFDAEQLAALRRFYAPWLDAREVAFIARSSCLFARPLCTPPRPRSRLLITRPRR